MNWAAHDNEWFGLVLVHLVKEGFGGTKVPP